MFSASPQLLIAGSDPGEWYSGHAGVEILVRQISELPFVKIEPGTIQAFCSGGVGWLADQPVLRSSDGTGHIKRVTAVALLERGQWRFVQWHAATPVGNDQFYDFSLTTSVGQLASVAVDRPNVERGSAPDGTVTIVFSDIESSTVLLRATRRHRVHAHAGVARRDRPGQYGGARRVCREVARRRLHVGLSVGRVRPAVLPGNAGEARFGGYPGIPVRIASACMLERCCVA